LWPSRSPPRTFTITGFFSDSACSTNTQTISEPDGNNLFQCSANGLGGSTYKTCDPTSQNYTLYTCTDTACQTGCSATTTSAIVPQTCFNAGGYYVKASCTSSLPSVPSGDAKVSVYEKSDCSDSVAGQVFVVLNSCFPSQGGGYEKTTQSGNTVTDTSYTDSGCTSAVTSTSANPNPTTITLDGSCHLLTGANLYYKGSNAAGHLVASVALIAALIAALLSL